MVSRRVVLTTFGSLGDLHPFLALGQALGRRGHRAVVATLPVYEERVRAAGLAFWPVRAAVLDGEPTPELMRRVFDRRRGVEFIVRRMVMPALRTAYEDTLAAAEGADLLVAHPLTFATRLVAEVRGLPWASTQLAPVGFLSAYDPPLLSEAPGLARMRGLGHRFWGPLFRLAKMSVRGWTAEYARMRRELGLPGVASPLFEGGHAPELVLAMFSGLLGAKQPDWPQQAEVTGFPFYEEGLGAARGEVPGSYAAGEGWAGFGGGFGVELAAEVEAFLQAGEAPIVFTLGSSAVIDAGRFYQESARAAAMVGRRALLLAGRDRANWPAGAVGTEVMTVEYAPFARVFSRAAVVVHQGGVGTTAQAMRAGRPMLVMPYAVDQPDNADRVRRLGVARVIDRRAYTAESAARELGLLLGDETYARRAAAVGEAVRAEDGAERAAELLERLMG